MLGLYTEEDKKQAFSIISDLGLTEQAYKRCSELSGGQKQRVGIARAIMQQPKVLLCDEPIASLDPKSSKVIMDHLAKINKTKNITCMVNREVIGIVTKCDKADPTTAEEWLRLSGCETVFHVDSKTGTGINKVLEHLKNHIKPHK